MSKLSFDPKTLKKPVPIFPKWATYIPDRSGKTWKVHDQRGHALNAFQYRDNVILYEFIDNEWVEIYRVEDGLEPQGKITHCHKCNVDLWEWKGDAQRVAGYWYFHGQKRWVENPLRRVGFCYPCDRKQ